MLDENARILRVCEDLNGKHYLPKYTEEEQWKRHFGCEKWTAIVQQKHMFDPHAILAPGQNMFRRNQNPPPAGPAAAASFRLRFIMKLDYKVILNKRVNNFQIW
jgi:cytokinin dehydrogenase